MFRLTDAEPIRRHSQRAIARKAGCSVQMVNGLVTGAVERVSEHIARGIADATGADFDTMFEDTGRRQYDKAPK